MIYGRVNGNGHETSQLDYEFFPDRQQLNRNTVAMCSSS